LRYHTNEALLHFLKLLPLRSVLGLSGLLLFKQALGAVLELTLHLFLIDLNTFLVPLYHALISRRVLARLRLSELDLLFHQSSIFLEVNVLVVQLVFFDLKLAAHLIVLLLKFDAFELILLLLLVKVLLLACHHVPRRLNLVLKSDFLALEIGDFVDHQLILFDELAPLSVVRFVLLVDLQLMGVLLLLQHLHLLRKLFVVGLELLGEQRDLAIFNCHSLLQRLGELLDLIIELALNLLSFLLLEQNLVLVVQLCFREALVTLFANI